MGFSWEFASQGSGGQMLGGTKKNQRFIFNYTHVILQIWWDVTDEKTLKMGLFYKLNGISNTVGTEPISLALEFKR